MTGACQTWTTFDDCTRRHCTSRRSPGRRYSPCQIMSCDGASLLNTPPRTATPHAEYAPNPTGTQRLL